MSSIAVEVAVILALVVANGLFALSEFALVAARRVRLERLARGGDRRARAALELLAKPSEFLSMVQIGITLVGILAGAVGGATLAEELAGPIAALGVRASHAELVAVGVVVLGITYLSLVVGELVPKRIALAYPEAITRAIAPSMRRLATVARPAVWLLSAPTHALLRVVGLRPPSEPPVTEDEIRLLVRQGAETGAVEVAEQAMVERIFRLGDRPIGAVMTPRTDVVWLDADDPPAEIRAKIEASHRSRFPVGVGSLDRVVGVVHAKDLLSRALAGEPLDLRARARPAIFVPEHTPALRVLDRLRDAAPHLAIVVDERGDLQGVVTVNRIVEAIIGELATGGGPPEPHIVRREDGSWSVDGMLGVDELRDLLDVAALPEGAGQAYHTLAGFVLLQLGRIPAIGDRFEWGGYRFEVLDMDVRRVDRVLIARGAPPGGRRAHA